MVLVCYKSLLPGLSGTCFEDLSNELMYEIFDYLDAGNAFDAFYELNYRFQCLFTHSSVPLKIDYSLISKSTFKYYSKYILTSYLHRIISFRFPHQMSIEIFKTLFSFNSFLQLRSLTFYKITTEKMISYLHDFTCLPKLFSLTITIIDHSNEDNILCQLIFRLPVLRYCKISFGNSRKEFPLPISDIKTLQTSSIEYLIINGFYNIDGLIPILSSMPKLHHFSCNSLWGSNNLIEYPEKMSSSLKYLSLKLGDVSFEKFKSIISRFDFELKVLRITALFDKKYLDADHWQTLILKHMPKLSVFDYECHCNTIDDIDQWKIYHNLIEKFHSAFWFERNWFFGHRHGHYYNKTYAHVYSINPYRKNHYSYAISEQHERCLYEDSGLNLAEYVSINTEALTTKSTMEFLRINELDLIVDNTKYDPIIISKLSSIIPLTQLTRICFSHKPFSIGILLDILKCAINVHTLVFHNTKMLDIQRLTFEQKQILNSLIQKNQIKKLVLNIQYTFRYYRFLFNLCPRLTYLQIKLPKKFQIILNYLLNENFKKNSQLCLLCILNTDNILFKQIQTLIDRDKLLCDYSIEIIGNELYLWW